MKKQSLFSLKNKNHYTVHYTVYIGLTGYPLWSCCCCPSTGTLSITVQFSSLLQTVIVPPLSLSYEKV